MRSARKSLTGFTAALAGLALLTLGAAGGAGGAAQAATDTTGPTFTMQYSAHIVDPSDVMGVQGLPDEDGIRVEAIQKWKASDPSGICDYQLYNYDARDDPHLFYEGLETSYSFTMGDVEESNGGYYWFHWILRVQDCAGNWSNNDDWDTGFFPTSDRFIDQPGARNSTVTYDDATVKFAGGWKSSNCKCFIGGTNRNTKTKGASAKFTYTGAVAAWVSETGPKRGKAKVYQDGVLKATVNLQPRRTTAPG